MYPATSPYVTAVGGTSLTPSNGFYTETAWSGANSHCSAVEPKPSWQTATGDCALRPDADVSAVADPYPGVAVYDIHNGGWIVVGGTSAASPIIAATYALAGTPGAADYPASYPYMYRSYLHDVTSGSNGSCGSPMCNAGTGWDGPTGLGTPATAVAFNPISITVPDVTDMTLSQATQVLQAAGLAVGNVSNLVVYDSSQGGRVVDQSPHAGTQTAMGTSVAVHIGIWSGVNR
jgi:subtilase family serine protease